MFIQGRCRCRGPEIIHTHKFVPVTQQAIPWLAQCGFDHDAGCITNNAFSPAGILLPEQFKAGRGHDRCSNSFSGKAGLCGKRDPDF